MEDIGDVNIDKEKSKKYLVYGLVIGGILLVAVMVMRAAASSGSSGELALGGGSSGGSTAATDNSPDYAGELSYQQGLADIQTGQASAAEMLQEKLLSAQTQAQINAGNASTANDVTVSNTNTNNSIKAALAQLQDNISQSNAATANANSQATVAEQLQALLITATTNAQNSVASNTEALNEKQTANNAAVASQSYADQIKTWLSGQQGADAEANTQSANLTNTFISNITKLASAFNSNVKFTGKNGEIEYTNVGLNEALTQYGGSDILKLFGLTGAGTPLVPTPTTNSQETGTTASQVPNPTNILSLFS